MLFRVSGLCLFLSAVLVVPHPASGTATERPNILVIVTDDQRNRDTMHVMPRTLARFAGEGTQYTKAVATTPVCCPSRASILTGQYAHNHQVRTNYDVKLLDHTTTIQRYLDEAGYQTALAGKFLNKFPMSTRAPYFDRWAHGGGTYYDAEFNIDGTVQTVPGYATDFLGSWSTSVLEDFEAADDEPWFLYIGTKAPHAPFTAEADYANADVGTWDGNPAVAEVDRSDKPPWIASAGARLADGRAERQAQLRTLMSVDDLVDDVFARIDTLDETNTIAFFLSDNGYMWAEHGLLDKRHPYLQSTEIPFYVRWPGRIAAGETSSDLVGTIDIAPTILEAAGLSQDPANPMDGRSLLAPGSRNRILMERWDERPWASLRGPGYQYTEWYDDAGAIVFREYYDLAHDYWQLSNLLGDDDVANDPDIEALSSQLAADRTCTGSSGPAACPGEERNVPSLSVSDTYVLEGDTSTGDALFRISLSEPAVVPVTVEYATVDETATDDADYRRVSGSLIVDAGSLGASVTVPIIGDLRDERDEIFHVRITGATGATIDDWRDAHGRGTIADDDLPEITVSDSRIVEGHSGSQTIAFEVSLTSTSPTDVSASYRWADGTATAIEDYSARAGIVTIPAGARSAVVRAKIIGDTRIEPDETFFVDLSDPTGATMADGRGMGTIVNDDVDEAPPSIAIADVQVVEGATKRTASFVVTLSSQASSDVTFAYSTEDGTATAGLDYVARSGTSSIPAGSRSRVIAITVRGDVADEPDETFYVNLSAPSGATIADGRGAGTILDDD